MAENPIRVLLDFRELNFKFYKFVWKSISPRELVTIKDLKDDILKKFSFERTDLLLFLRDGLLPDEENISNILRENDNIRIFYSEPFDFNQNDSISLNHEVEEISANEGKIKSSEKCKGHSSVLGDKDEQKNPSKKRKCSFSNGTYVFSSHTPKILMKAVPDDEKSTDLDTNESGRHCNSSKVKKKLKYCNDVSEKSLVSKTETFASGDLTLERNQNKANFCKKKKKHKHSKDFEISSSSKKEINADNTKAASEMKEHRLCKKQNVHKHSHDASEINSMYKTALSLISEITGTPKKLDDSVQDLKIRNKPSVLIESLSKAVQEDALEVTKLAPTSFSAPSVSTSSGIGYSLKTSEENYPSLILEGNCSMSHVSGDVLSLEDKEDLSNSQGNDCKKKKRKRRRKRKPLLIDQQIDESVEGNLDMSYENESQSIKDTSTAFNDAEISPENEKTSDCSKSNTFLLIKNAKSLETKSDFLKPFDCYLPSTSTPLIRTQNVSPRKNIMSKMINCSNAFQDQTCSATTSQSVILHTTLKKMNGNSTSIHSSPGNVIRNNATVLNHNIRGKGLLAQINKSQTNDSLSDLEIKNRFLDPNFSYKGCPPLNSCPLAGTHIAYKVLELDASYSPVVSNYKEGIVKAVNSQTDELEIELIEPEVKEGRTGKFEVNVDDPPSCEVVRKVTLSWPSLIDPLRVIY